MIILVPWLCITVFAVHGVEIRGGNHEFTVPASGWETLVTNIPRTVNVFGEGSSQSAPSILNTCPADSEQDQRPLSRLCITQGSPRSHVYHEWGTPAQIYFPRFYFQSIEDDAERRQPAGHVFQVDAPIISRDGLGGLGRIALEWTADAPHEVWASAHLEPAILAARWQERRTAQLMIFNLRFAIYYSSFAVRQALGLQRTPSSHSSPIPPIGDSEHVPTSHQHVTQYEPQPGEWRWRHANNDQFNHGIHERILIFSTDSLIRETVRFPNDAIHLNERMYSTLTVEWEIIAEEVDDTGGIPRFRDAPRHRPMRPGRGSRMRGGRPRSGPPRDAGQS